MAPAIPGWALALTRALISPRWCACAVRYARLVLVAPFLEEPPTHFEACNLTRTARVQWKDCIQPCDSKLSNVAFGTRRSGLRLPLFWMPRPSAQSREQTTVVSRFDLARGLSCLSDYGPASNASTATCEYRFLQVSFHTLPALQLRQLHVTLVRYHSECR